VKAVQALGKRFAYLKRKRRFAIENPSCGCCFSGEVVPQRLEEDIKLGESQKNMVSGPAPQEEIERTNKLVEELLPKAGALLTVGDLAIVREK